MGRTGHGQIGRKLKGSRCNTREQTYSKGSKITTYLIEYFPKTLMKKEVRKNPNIMILL